MKIDELRAIRDAKPFRPFRLELKDGSGLFVRRPDEMRLPPNGAVLICSDEGQMQFLKTNFIVSAIPNPPPTVSFDELRKHYYASPFRPFTLHLKGGRNAHVGHPELMILDEGEDTLVVSEPGIALRVIDLDAVTEIEFKRVRSRRNGGKSGGS